jgi:hypothetical protein
VALLGARSITDSKDNSAEKWVSQGESIIDGNLMSVGLVLILAGSLCSLEVLMLAVFCDGGSSIYGI